MLLLHSDKEMPLKLNKKKRLKIPRWRKMQNNNEERKKNFLVVAPKLCEVNKKNL